MTSLIRRASHAALIGAITSLATLLVTTVALTAQTNIRLEEQKDKAQDRAHTAQTEVSELSAEKADIREALAEANRRLRRNGGQPVDPNDEAPPQVALAAYHGRTRHG